MFKPQCFLLVEHQVNGVDAETWDITLQVVVDLKFVMVFGCCNLKPWMEEIS